MKQTIVVLAAVALLAGCENRYEDSPVLDGFPPATEDTSLHAAPTPAQPEEAATPHAGH